MQTLITVLVEKRVVINSEANEPVPAGRQPQQDRSAVKRERDRRRAFRVDNVSFTDDVDILCGSEDRLRLDLEGQVVTVSEGSKVVEVEEVLVSGVVGGVEEAEDATQVALGAGDEVS